MGNRLTTDTNTEARLQDTVAKVSKMNLRDTVKVLRALSLVMMYRKSACADALNKELSGSATSEGVPAPLHAKPDKDAIEACSIFYGEIVEDAGDGTIASIRNLTDDPFYYANNTVRTE